ncbi:MAG: NADH-quinone oxidoreductase subunit NuoK [Pelovirga sp.]|jgi:NADH:ubiquinone oxidoreductase subunit K
MMPSDHLTTYLIVGAFLLCIGLFGMIRNRTLIGMLICVELMLAGAGLNFMAFNRFTAPDPAVGQAFTLFIMGIAAAEAAIVISLVIAIHRRFHSVDPQAIDDLHG